MTIYARTVKEAGEKVCGTNDCRHPLVPICRQGESICNRYCGHYEEEVCMHRFKPPYVCNGCSEVKNVLLQRHSIMQWKPRGRQQKKNRVKERDIVNGR